MYWLASRGATVAVPVGNSRHWDLIAELDGRLSRIQVKTSVLTVRGRWQVAVCTRGGNQSWNREVKRLDPSCFDYLFVLTGDGRRWFIPAERVDGGCSVHLGGPKYADFEVDPGDPIPGHIAPGGPSTIGVRDHRGDVRVVKGAAL